MSWEIGALRVFNVGLEGECAGFSARGASSLRRCMETLIVPLKEIEFGFGYIVNKIPMYPMFYLLKGGL